MIDISKLVKDSRESDDTKRNDAIIEIVACDIVNNQVRVFVTSTTLLYKSLVEKTNVVFVLEPSRGKRGYISCDKIISTQPFDMVNKAQFRSQLHKSAQAAQKNRTAAPKRFV